ncbi:MAG: DUF3379 family protein [Pseudomonadota bacterium]
MNCEEYRQALGEDPKYAGGAAHLSECADCQAFRASMARLESRIEAALELPVPALNMPALPAVEAEDTQREDGAGDKVVVMQPRVRKSAPVWLAMAASVVLVALLGVRMFGGDTEYASLGEEIVAHLDHEPYALRVSSEAVSDERLARVVPANIANLDHSAGLITYAQPCEINGKTVPHLVIQGKNGPVTVILLPDERVLEAETLDGEGINGVLIPVGNGSIAIIGQKEENLGAIRESIVNSVTWSI